MIAWMAHRAGWFVIRTVITLGCILTIHNLINSRGHRIDFGSLLLVSVCAIVAIRMWMPSYHKDKE